MKPGVSTISGLGIYICPHDKSEWLVNTLAGWDKTVLVKVGEKKEAEGE